MALVRWEPRNMFDLRTEIDRLFDRFWHRTGNGNEAEFAMTTWHPSADVEEREEAYVVTADLPGINKDDVKVQIVDNILTISGERKSERKDDNFHRVERTYGRFSRSFTLPSPGNADEISARYKDGVLTVTVPKAEEAKARQIAVA